MRFGLCSVAALTLLLSATCVRAQSTDGYHAIQVFPIVVDTASYAQRFSLRNPYSRPVNLSADYYPANGTAQPGPLHCPDVVLPVSGIATFPSLRAICPALVTGSAFGTLVLRSPGTDAFAGYSRVSSASGIGLAVEAFPAHVFSSTTDAMVTGLRRSAATTGTPAFQSNCFVGNLATATPGAVQANKYVTISVRDSSLQVLGQTTLSLLPGRIVRLLDVFAAVGVPNGDLLDASATFLMTGGGPSSGILAFCTVQDNTSFGADFRIAKPESGALDFSALRDTVASQNQLQFSDNNGQSFNILGATANTHLFYFKHPDVVSCELWFLSGPQTGVDYGLEMRLRGRDGSGTQWQVLAGGNDTIAFSGLYLGDKADRAYGANSQYLLEVESNGRNEGAYRPYAIHCVSGSGSTQGEIVQAGAPIAF